MDPTHGLITYDENALQRVREDRFLIDRCDTWLFEEIQPHLGQRIIEIGCGLGNLVSHLQDREFYCGIDLSLESINYLDEKYVNCTNLRFRCLDINDISVLRLKQYQFDTVVSLNTFEHISDDMLALRHAYELLDPGGNLLLIVPAHSVLYGSIDQAIGHYRRYSKSDLTSKLSTAGFRLLKVKFINALGAVGWFLNSRLLAQHVPPKGQLKVMNWIVPICQRVEKFVQFPFGISLFVVAERQRD